MRLKSLKNVWAGLAFAIVAGVGAWMVSCENPNNPFKSNMGEKVPIERPTITVTSPATSSFVKGKISIEGIAAAYRKLGDVKIKITNVIDEWTSLTKLDGGSLDGDVKKKAFSYTIDTTQLPDGYLYVQFQVTDPDFVVESNKYLYIVKNGPSEITMSSPDDNNLYTIINAETNTKILSTGEITTGTKLTGTVSDRRGIKPGYPKIKIWKDGDEEPDNWARLFISGIDGTYDGSTDIWQYDYYGKDRNNAAVEREVSFEFKLSKYTLNSKNEVVYTLNNSGQYEDFELGLYHFRIFTSDTFFEEKVGAENYEHPREPHEDEKEITIYEPNESIYGDGSYHTIRVVPPSGEITRIEINNKDISASDLEKQPNIYIEKQTSSKIVVNAAERAPGKHADFRLRVNIHRESGIDHAVLAWSHPQNGRGTLPWDDLGASGDDGYVDDSDVLMKGTKGHRGIPNPDPDGKGKIFQFTGFVDTDIQQDGVGVVPLGNVFKSSGSDYELTVKAYVTAAESDVPEIQVYRLTLDDDGPDVEVLDIKGKSASPELGPDPKVKGRTINKNAYTVNDNIQVSQYSTAVRNIRVDPDSNRRVIKWFVELANDDLNKGNDHLDEANILMRKLEEFRGNPTSPEAQTFLAYFKNDAEPLASVRSRGMVDADGSFKLNVDTREIQNGVKVGNNDLNGKYLWLYVVAQDGLYNLGYTMQKLYVDDDGDKPVVEIIGDRLLATDNGGPETTADLFPGLDSSNNPIKATINILGRGEAVDLSVADDDAMRPVADSAYPNDKIISITLQSDNFPGVTGNVDIGKLMGNKVFSSNDTLILTQSLMTEAFVAGMKQKPNGAEILEELYGPEGPQGQTRNFLLDGVYTLTITIPDAQSQKVKIGNIDPVAVTTTKTYHFVVQNMAPDVQLTGGLESGFMSSDPKDITGTVSSRLQIQKMTITFTPDVINGNSSSTSTYTDTIDTLTPIPGSSPDIYGNYNYTWVREDVDFTNGNPNFDWRRLGIAAWDNVGVSGDNNMTLYVDSTPPKVSLFAFNFGRADNNAQGQNRVNGKVPIEVEALDENGIGEQDDSKDPAIRWFILPSAPPAAPDLDPRWETTPAQVAAASGKSGYFTVNDFRGGARYRTIIDTTQGVNALPSLPAGQQYNVFVVARDKAGNAGNTGTSTPYSSSPLCSFIVDQTRDAPVLKSMEPENGKPIGGVSAVLKITGVISDDDGFAVANKDSYVKILFPETSDDEGRPLTWPDSNNPANWHAVKGDIDTVSGDIEYTFDFSTGANPPAYLIGDGYKYYRLRVTDEANRGPGPDSWGAYTPEGKNPDLYKGDGNLLPTPPAGYVALPARTVDLPSENGSYYFFLKHDNPKVYFDEYDPNSEHPNYSVKRPVYASGGKAQLLKDLSGTVEDRSLDRIQFIYGKSHTLVCSNAVGGVCTGHTTHLWKVPDVDEADDEEETDRDWLEAFDGADEGMYSITIQATDTLGNSTPVEWSFSIDTNGPVISFDNISTITNNVRVVSGSAGEVKITGTFTDLYSAIGETFDYRFDSLPWVTGYNIVNNGGSINDTTATWSVLIDPTGTYNGAFPDGEHTFSIRARDKWDNEKEELNVKFIVDRQAPQLLGASGLIVTGAGLKDSNNNTINRPLDENERVFSATVATEANAQTSVSEVFTLSGMVYEHNLATLSAVIRNGTNPVVTVPDITGIDNWPGAWKNGGIVTSTFDNSDSNFSITRAATADLTAFYGANHGLTINNRYVWKLKIRVKDFYALMNAGAGMNDDGVARAIVITARDRGSSSGRTGAWQFYLDSEGPTIEFSNVSASGTILQDTDIVLKGAANEKTTVQKVQYKLDKYNYSAATWSDNGFVDATIIGSGSRVNWEIGTIPTLANGGDGRYRLTIRAYDWSISATGGGNETESGPREFYVDRKDPEITWGATNNYYKWVSDTPTTEKLEFTLTIKDDNTIQTSPTAPSVTMYPVNTPTGAYSLTYDVTPVPPASWDKTTTEVKVTITKPTATAINGRQTLELTVRDKTGKKATTDHTLTIYLDNAKPEITIEQPTPNTDNAIVGRVEFRGSFTKETGSPIRRVAFHVSTGAAAPDVSDDLSDANLKANDWFYNDSSPGMPYKLWVHESSGAISNVAPPSEEAAEWIPLMEITDGLAKATLKLYDTRRFNDAISSAPAGTPAKALLGATETAPAGVKWNGVNISTSSFADKDVNKLRIWLLAIDEADNHRTEKFDYWVYPAGDYPTVTITSPNKTDTPANRQLNGTVKIQGAAEDNYRVKNVWFRVLKDGGASAIDVGSIPAHHDPVTFDYIPNWTDTWEAPTTGTLYQTAQSKTFKTAQGGAPETSGGWYRANIASIAKNVIWYAQVNAKGELDPSGLATSRGIIIQTLAEDTIRNDDDTGYATGDGLFSIMEEARATVVNDQPIFANEEVGLGSSAALDVATDGWGNILSTAVTGRAAYHVTVRHNASISSIRWTNAPAATGVTATTNILSAYANYAANLADMNASSPSGPGIAAKAAPKDPITGNQTALAAGTYLIWETLAAVPAGAGFNADSTENARHTTFTTTGGAVNLGSGVLLKKVDGYFEWQVTVDLHTGLLGYVGQSLYYEVRLEAYDNSKPSPLSQRKYAQIPIDSQPPVGVYTHTTNVVGSNASFGGEAEDVGESTAPKGLARVVLWFSRDTNGDAAGGEASIVWNENAVDGTGPHNATFNNHGGAAITINTYSKPIPAGVDPPLMPAADFTGTNNSCIVIDRQDPLGYQEHHGHKLAMGWSSGSAMENSWYVTLDSRRIESGRVTAHYIVIDRAGNATYYNQKLMILNGVARISSITLATDIYGDESPLDLQSTWTGGATNLKFGQGTNLVTTGTNPTSAMEDIRDRYEAKMAAITGDDPDEAKGISESIPIDTSKPGVYGVVFDQKDFVARNNLLAVKVNTLVPQSSQSKDRYYRVEYVSSAVLKIGTAGLTNTATGIHAGRVYIINNAGTNFPWGVLGAQGETFQRGTVFLALQEGSDLDDVYKTGAYGNPSAWELNGSYYGAGASLNRTVPSSMRFTGTSDVMYNKLSNTQSESDNIGMTAEFVYRTGAFGATAGQNIRDFNAGGDAGANLDAQGRPLGYDPALAANSAQNPYDSYSLFIVKVFDGPEAELFGDFALLSIRVNNNDVTPPYAQLYDLNPKAEPETEAVFDSGEFIGDNRKKGGLLTEDGVKSGHIEPRNGTSLTNTEMGGAAGSGSISRPAANTGAYFTYDTVSGEVIVRGYAEDNQRIARVDLEFFDVANTNRLNISTNPVTTSVTILERDAEEDTEHLVKVPTALAGKVKFTEKVELSRHRIEWAYKWNSETIPGANYVVGDYNVRAVAYNANSTINIANNATVPANTRVHTSANIPRGSINAANRNAWDYFNPDFPVSGTRASGAGEYLRYNDTRIHLRPYITGFKRETSAHDTRSRQGRYIFARGEPVIITGYNLKNGIGDSNLILPGAGTARVSTTTDEPSSAQAAANGIATVNEIRHRYFVVPATAFTSTNAANNGLVTMTVNGYSAVNTPAPVATATNETAGTLRPMVSSRPVVQPWNKEYSASVKGSTLWDDYTMVHIWQSNTDTGIGNPVIGAMSSAEDRPRFIRGNFNITHPDMSIDPSTGRLWESHQEGGRRPGSNIYPGGGAYVSNNSGTLVNATTNGYYTQTDTAGGQYALPAGMIQVGAWSEHMTYTGIYRNGADTWVISNSITPFNDNNRWRWSGGMWLWGPIQNASGEIGNTTVSHYPRTNTGTTDTYHQFKLPANTGYYGIETLWYNGSNGSRSGSAPLKQGEQFHNPHIVTSSNGNNVHISYYDEKDGSIKYRYNVKNTPGTVNTEAMTRDWVNLDGGADVDDNADAGTAPARNAAGNVNTSYQGTYSAETASNYGGNANSTAGANQPYGGSTTALQGTSYTFTQANGGTAPSGNLTQVRVQNGSYVTADTVIYRVGTNDLTAGKAATAAGSGPNEGFVVLNERTPTGAAVTGGNAAFRIYPINTASSRIVNAATRMTGPKVDAGKHNAIAVDGSGFPVIAYYDDTNQKLKIAISNNVAPKLATNWQVSDVAGAGSGTGEYVSIQINGNTVHIAAMNANDRTVVYIKGTIAGTAFTTTTVQVVDSVGNVGSWCRLSLDAAGNPWIAYMDEGYRGSRDGVKVAFLNTTTFYKGSSNNYNGQDIDPKGASISGWETMHVPTRYGVEDAQLGMERFPTIRNTTASKTTGLGAFAAVGYLGQDYYRIAYYVD